MKKAALYNHVGNASYIPSGDIAKCNEWLPFAQGQLRAMIVGQPGVQTKVIYPTNNVEITLMTAPNRIFISTKGGVFVTVADRASDVYFISDLFPPFQSRINRFIYDKYIHVVERENYFAHGRTSYVDVDLISNDVNQDNILEWFGGSWEGENIGLSWRDTVGAVSGQVVFYINGKYQPLSVSLPLSPVTGENPQTRLIAACVNSNNDDLILLYPDLSSYSSVIIGIWVAMGRYALSIYGANPHKVPGVDTFEVVHIVTNEIFMPEKRDNLYPEILSGFSSNAKSVCFATYNYPYYVSLPQTSSDKSQKVFKLTFDSTYSTYTSELIYEHDRTVLSAGWSNSVSEIGGISITANNSGSLTIGEPAIIHIKPEGNNFAALRAQYDSYNQTASCSINTSETDSAAAHSYSLSMTGYYDVISLTPTVEVKAKSNAISAVISDVLDYTSVVSPPSFSWAWDYSFTKSLVNKILYYSAKNAMLVYSFISEDNLSVSESDDGTTPSTTSSIGAKSRKLIMAQGFTNTDILTVNASGVSGTTTITSRPFYIFSDFLPHTNDGGSGEILINPTPDSVHLVYVGDLPPSPVSPLSNSGYGESLLGQRADLHEGFHGITYKACPQDFLIEQNCAYNKTLYVGCVSTYILSVVESSSGLVVSESDNINKTLYINLKTGEYTLNDGRIDLPITPHDQAQTYYPIGLTNL